MDPLPLSEAVLSILISLAQAPRHGYAILKDVESISAGRVRLSTGTLYGAIQRLLAQGWIERVDDPLPQDGSRERKAYALTEAGKRILAAETARMTHLAGIAAQRMEGRTI